MYLWHSPANKDGTQSDPSQSKSCQHALLEHINGTVYPWGNQTHTHTRPFTKILFPIPWSKPFDKRKDVLGVNFSCNRSYVTIFCICVMSLLPQSPPKNTSAEADFLIDQNINLYTNENSENIDHIFYTITRGQRGSYQIS